MTGWELSRTAERKALEILMRDGEWQKQVPALWFIYDSLRGDRLIEMEPPPGQTGDARDRKARITPAGRAYYAKWYGE